MSKRLITPSNSILPINKFNQIYIGVDINNFQLDVMDESFLTNTKFDGKLFTTIGEYIGKVLMFPFSIFAIYYYNHSDLLPSTQSFIKLGGVNLTHAKGYKLNYQTDNYYTSAKLHVATFHIERVFNNFLDSAQYTQLRMYLPYFNYIDLNIDEVMHSYIHVYYYIDVMTGLLTCYIEKGTSASPTNNDVFIQSIDTQVGIEIPISQSNANERDRKFLSNLLSNVTSLVTSGGVTKAISSSGGIVNSTLESLQKHTNYRPMTNTFDGIIQQPQDCFIERITTAPSTSYGTSGYNEIYGLPSDSIVFVSDVQGYTSFKNFHLDGFTFATSDELDLIDGLLKDGIILDKNE